MSMVSKSITLRVPVDIIYRALKDTRLEKLFPEFFVGVTRKPINDKENEDLTFHTTTQDSQIQVIEKFRLKISGANCTNLEYITETNVTENDLVVTLYSADTYSEHSILTLDARDRIYQWVDEKERIIIIPDSAILFINSNQ